MESAGSETVNLRNPPSLSRDGASKPATQRPERNSIVPPYWQRHEHNEHSSSSVSCNASADNVSRPAPILLEDHTDEGSDQCKALWAKHVTIDDYVIVSGTGPGIGAYVVWNCTVETLDVSFVCCSRALRCKCTLSHLRRTVVHARLTRLRVVP